MTKSFSSSSSASSALSWLIPLGIGTAAAIHYGIQRYLTPTSPKSSKFVTIPENAEFQKAAEWIQSDCKLSLSNEQRLQLYGLYKQATCGPCTLSRPSMIDFEKAAKWESWSKLEDLSSLQAQEQYIELVQSFQSQQATTPDLDDQDQKEEDTGPGSFTPAVSTLAFNDGDPEAWQVVENGFYYATFGDLDSIQQLVAKNEIGLNDQDGEGRTMLHWAVDREQTHVVKYLIAHDAALDLQDEDGMTPLAYAVSCDHRELCVLLHEAGADAYVADTDGETPYMSASPELKAIFDSNK